jgi:hypothetical protein
MVMLIGYLVWTILGLRCTAAMYSFVLSGRVMLMQTAAHAPNRPLVASVLVRLYQNRHPMPTPTSLSESKCLGRKSKAQLSESKNTTKAQRSMVIL